MPGMRIATGQEVAEAVKHCGNSADLVAYLIEHLNEQFKKAKVTKETAVQDLAGQLDQWREGLSKTEAIRENGVWFGVEPQSSAAIQAQIAQENTLHTLSEEGAERLKFRYALAEEDGQFVRAFGINGEAVKDATLLQRLDDIVHSEFAKQSLVLDADGRLRSHADGKTKPASLEQLSLVCQGLEKAFQQQNIEFVAQQEASPSRQPSPAKATTSVPAEPVAVQEAQAPSVSSEAPSTGPGAQG